MQVSPGSYSFKDLDQPLIEKHSANLTVKMFALFFDLHPPSFLRSCLDDMNLLERFREPARLPLYYPLVQFNDRGAQQLIKVKLDHVALGFAKLDAKFHAIKDRSRADLGAKPTIPISRQHALFA